MFIKYKLDVKYETQVILYDDWETLELLSPDGGWYISFVLLIKMTSCACLVGLFGISKSLLRSFAGVWVSCTTGKKEVSSANSFALIDLL